MIGLMSFVYFCEFAIFWYVCFLVGNKLFKLAKFQNFNLLQNLSYKTALGYGTIAIIGLLLALASIFQKFYIITILVLILVFSAKEVKNHLKIIFNLINNPKKIASLFKQAFFKYPLLKILLLVWGILYFWISLVPWAMSNDGLAYHIPFVTEIIKQSHLYFPLLDLESYGFLPLLSEIFYGIQISIFGNLVAFKITQFLFFILLVAIASDFVKKHLSGKFFSYSLIALLFANTPLVFIAIGGGMIDIITFSFGFFSLFLLLESLLSKEKNEEKNKILFLSSVFLGLALSTKYLALFFAVSECLILAFHCTIERLDWRNIARKFILFAGPAVLIAGFWYIKNLFLVSNPFYPMFEPSRADFSDAVGAFAVPRTFLNYIFFPFVIFGKWGMFKLSFALFTGLLFGFAYLMLAFLLFKKKIDKLIIYLIIFTETYLLFLFFFSHQIRFAVPALISGSILFILLLDKTILELKNSSHWKEKFLLFGIIFTTSILLIFSIFTLKPKIYCLIGKTDINECYSQNTGFAVYATNFINNNLKNEKVLDYFNTFYSYQLKNKNSLVDDYCNVEPSQIAGCLKDKGIRYYLDDKIHSQHLLIVAKKENDIKKSLVIKYFLDNAELVFESYEKERDTFIGLYRLK